MANSQLKDHELKIDGMTCGGCVRSVEKAIERADPAARAEVSLAAGRASIRSALERNAFVEAIEAAGYDIVA